MNEDSSGGIVDLCVGVVLLNNVPIDPSATCSGNHLNSKE